MSSLFNVGTGGMLAQSEKMAAIGNNIANSQTVGYKRTGISFAETFASTKGIAPSGAQLSQGGGVTVSAATDWSNGVTEDTGEQGHLAIIGDGFFPVRYPKDPTNTVYYTRAGDFKVTEDPTTPGQYMLMRPNGACLCGGAIDGATSQFTIDGLLTFSEYPASLSISSDGAIEAFKVDGTAFAGGDISNSTLGLVSFRNPDALGKYEAGLFRETTLGDRATDANNSEAFVPGANGAGVLRQGALENSNVDLVKEFADMIVAQRSFQANSKIITTGDQMIQEILQMKR